jgi:hypothetical protein
MILVITVYWIGAAAVLLVGSVVSAGLVYRDRKLCQVWRYPVECLLGEHLRTVILLAIFWPGAALLGLSQGAYILCKRLARSGLIRCWVCDQRANTAPWSNANAAVPDANMKPHHQRVSARHSRRR